MTETTKEVNMKHVKSKQIARGLKHISLFATREEVRVFEQIKKAHNRKTDSDMLRVLIQNEAEKILSAKTT